MLIALSSDSALESSDNPFSNRLNLIRRFQDTWRSRARACIQDVHLILLDVTLALIQAHFGERDNLRSLIQSVRMPLASRLFLLIIPQVSHRKTNQR